MKRPPGKVYLRPEWGVPVQVSPMPAVGLFLFGPLSQVILTALLDLPGKPRDRPAVRGLEARAQSLMP